MSDQILRLFLLFILSCPETKASPLKNQLPKRYLSPLYVPQDHTQPILTLDGEKHSYVNVLGGPLILGGAIIGTFEDSRINS
jgi:hypothetical protein